MKVYIVESSQNAFEIERAMNELSRRGFTFIGSSVDSEGCGLVIMGAEVTGAPQEKGPDAEGKS